MIDNDSPSGLHRITPSVGELIALFRAGSASPPPLSPSHQCSPNFDALVPSGPKTPEPPLRGAALRPPLAPRPLVEAAPPSQVRAAPRTRSQTQMLRYQYACQFIAGGRHGLAITLLARAWTVEPLGQAFALWRQSLAEGSRSPALNFLSGLIAARQNKLQVYLAAMSYTHTTVGEASRARWALRFETIATALIYLGQGSDRSNDYAKACGANSHCTIESATALVAAYNFSAGGH